MELMNEIYSEITLFNLKRKARCMLTKTNMKHSLVNILELQSHVKPFYYH